MITDEMKSILNAAEIQLRELGCPNVARLLVQRGVGLFVSSLSAQDWREEKVKIKRFVEAYLGQS